MSSWALSEGLRDLFASGENSLGPAGLPWLSSPAPRRPQPFSLRFCETRKRGTSGAETPRAGLRSPAQVVDEEGENAGGPERIVSKETVV